MRELISYSNELNHYSEREFKIAQEKLNKHMNQTNFFRKKQHDFKKGDVITKDLSTQNMRREYFMDCVFFNSNLSDMGMSGSMFKQVGFEDCIINNTNRLSEQSIRYMINDYANAVGAPLHITPHMFRHTFATELHNEDVDIRYIQQFLGHSSIATTQIYTHISTSKTREILESKHPRNKMNLNLIS